MTKHHDRDYFYKYVTADVAKKIIKTLRVKCSSPLLLNDPFDSQITIQHDVENEKDLIHKTTAIICNWLQPITKGTNVGHTHRLICNEMLNDGSFVSDRYAAFGKFYKEVNEKTIEILKDDRVFCVSEKNNNLLMWSHYADEHKGAVIKFRCISEKNTALCAARPIKYSEKMPLLNVVDLFSGHDNILRKILDEILLTKSSDWAHESEWRLILKKQDGTQNFDLKGIFEEELDSIYLGCRMCIQDKNDILDIVEANRKSIKIFEAQKNRKEFKLDFKELK